MEEETSQVISDIPSYQKRVVVFLDVLGFKDHLRKRALPELVAIIDTFRNVLSSSTDAQEIEITSISDSIVIAAHLNNYDEATQFLNYLNVAFATLSFSKIWIRGAIVFGDYFKKNDLLLSPALAEAYTLESKVARFPRVILSSSFLNKLMSLRVKVAGVFPEEWTKSLNQFSHQDTDGFRYLDYMASFMDSHFLFDHDPDLYPNEDFEKIFKGMKKHFFAHKLALEHELQIHNENLEVKSKFLWLAHQHNRNYICSEPRPNDFEKAFGLFSEFTLSIGVTRKGTVTAN